MSPAEGEGFDGKEGGGRTRRAEGPASKEKEGSRGPPRSRMMEQRGIGTFEGRDPNFWGWCAQGTHS